MFVSGNEDIMRKSTGEIEFFTVIVGVFVALFILVAVVACNSGGGGGGNTYYYPQDTSHGYYDTHHHYHYYPKYDPRSKVYIRPKAGAPGVKVKPAPRSGGGSLFKSGGGKSFGGSSRRR